MVNNRFNFIVAQEQDEEILQDELAKVTFHYVLL
jgi:hypothetical protein